MSQQPSDKWTAGDLYQSYVGRWSRGVAVEFLGWLDAKPSLDWLDVGCGTGVLSEIVLERMRPRSLEGFDSSAGFIDYARNHVHDPRAAFELADAQALPLNDVRFDVAGSGLVLNFVPEPLRAVREMARVVRPDGVVAAYVWDYAGKMELMRYFWDAAVASNAAAGDLDEGLRFPLCQPRPLAELFARAGLIEVEVRSIDVPTRFRDFDDYWTPFLSGQGPAPGYAMSLTEEARCALRERIRAVLPIESDGSIALMARAWAVRGRVPK